MKYFYNYYDDDRREMVREEVTGDRAKWVLEGFYKPEAVPDMMTEPGEWRVLGGFIEVVNA